MLNAAAKDQSNYHQSIIAHGGPSKGNQGRKRHSGAGPNNSPPGGHGRRHALEPQYKQECYDKVARIDTISLVIGQLSRNLQNAY